MFNSKKIIQTILVQAFLIITVMTLSACSSNKKTPTNYTENEYTIAFEVDGETYFETKIGSNSSILFPINPTKTNYSFLGWYLDKNTWSEKLTSDYQVKQDIVAYAKWDETLELNQYVITYDYQCSQIEGEKTHSVIYNNSYTLVVPAREGYSFMGWYDELDNQYTDVNGESLVNWLDSSDRTLYAKWKAIDYIIEFNSNGGSEVANITKEYDAMVIAPTNPKKEGYNFVGWYSDEELTNNFTFTTMPMGGITLYAKWEVANYTIVFDSNGGSKITNITGEYNETISEPDSPTREGYRFMGWYSDKELTNQYTFITMPLEGITLYAKWKVNEYTITFESNGGSEVASITQSYNSKVIEPTNPTKEGYNFAGWYGDEELTKSYIFTTMPLEGIVLYAKWEIANYTIIFESNGGSKVTNITGEYDTIVNEPTKPVKEGYTFIDWYSDKELTNQYTFTTMPLEGITLYAKWKVNEYAITFESNGGSKVASITAGYDTIVNEPAKPAKEGHTFMGWYSNEGLTNQYTFTTMPLNGAVLYAKWEINRYSITFESNGGSKVASITQDYNTMVIMPINPTREGYTFKGWYSDEALANVYTFTTMPLNGITLYAKWTGITYTIIFEKYDGIGGSYGVTALYDASMPVASSPSQEGYTFEGYFDLEGTKYYNADMTSARNWDKNNNWTLYAKWEAIDYTISFECNGGSEVDGIVKGYKTKVTAPLDPTKMGYIFKGWYSDETLFNAYTFTTMPLNGITLYAKWDLAYYTITFETNGGSNVVSITQGYNTEVITPSDPIKDEHTFKGWYSDEMLSNAYTFTTMPLNGITLYAKWEEGTKGLVYTLIEGGYSVSVGSATNALNIIIPSTYNGQSVIAIGLYAFYRCINLTSITIPSSITNIDSSAFRDCIGLININVDSKNIYFNSIEGVLYNKDNSILIKYPAGKIETIYSILESVTTIGNSAFENCINLINIIIPEGVTCIEEWAFYNCRSLTSIVIPKGVTYIGQGAFLYCSSLESITIPFVGTFLNGITNTHFGYIFGAYDYHNNAKYIPSTLKEVIILGGINIYNNAFYNCISLENLIISEEVINIADDAFFGCDNLIDIIILESDLSIED